VQRRYDINLHRRQAAVFKSGRPGFSNGLSSVTITLNGEPFETAGPLTVTELLNRLDIDARRVAVEHNLVVVKRTAFDVTTIRGGDEVEIVNFVGGG
jgi:thiamine biosynthesis protein ThiS